MLEHNIQHVLAYLRAILPYTDGYAIWIEYAAFTQTHLAWPAGSS